MLSADGQVAAIIAPLLMVRRGRDAPNPFFVPSCYYRFGRHCEDVT